MTVLDHISSSIKAAATYNSHDVAAPRVILWTDKERLWESVADRIGECLDQFYILKPEVEGQTTGPSTWIRYHLSAEGGEGIPVVYLPGIGRHEFRSPTDFPEEARHLYALQFQGQFWTQLNGKDWTPSAVMSSEDGGLGLDMALNKDTITALRTQLMSVLETSVDSLRRKRLEAADFNGLAAGDPAGMMLHWMSDPEKVKEAWPPQQMAAFEAICKDQFKLSPANDGRLVAAEKLVAGGGLWEQIWQRYEEAPRAYRGLREILDLVKTNDLFDNSSLRLPKNNVEAENKLRGELLGLAEKPKDKASATVIELAKTHAKRARSIWAQLDEAPLADAAAHLGRMVSAIKEGLQASDWEGFAKCYMDSAWKVDAEALRSFAAVRHKKDVDAVSAALRAIYLPWLEEQAQRVSEMTTDYPNKSPDNARQLVAEAGAVYLFVDGLRADLANELCVLLESKGLDPKVETSWAALPTVTSTAKPAWAPLTEAVCGDVVSEGFEPQLSANHKPLKTAVFRDTITDLGFPWFPISETGDPSGSGWTEVADFDKRGHSDGAKLAWRLREELQVVHQRIIELIQAGWKKVVVITDHGWLWMPGGLPKTDLPTHLTASKWGRCALPQPGAAHSLPEVCWFWGNEHPVVLAPGVTALKNGVEYAHGGLTIQEALTASITIESSVGPGLSSVTISSVRWLGLRLKIKVEGGNEDLELDIRGNAASSASTKLGAEAALPRLKANGEASVLIENDEHEGDAAILVILQAGEVICKQPVTIGEN